MAFLAREVGQNEFFDQEVLPALLRNGFFEGLSDVVVACDHQVFDEIVILKKVDEFLSKLVVEVVVLHVQIIQICVVFQAQRKVYDFFPNDSIFADVKVLESMVGKEQLFEEVETL
jgi:hypothetical protein